MEDTVSGFARKSVSEKNSLTQWISKFFGPTPKGSQSEYLAELFLTSHLLLIRRVIGSFLREAPRCTS
jgi:hypothetical protein